MGFFGKLFRKETNICAACGAPSAGVHGYRTDYFKDKLDQPELKLCTPCLLARLQQALRDFSGCCAVVEPVTADGTVFLRFADDKFQANLAAPLQTYFAEPHSCIVCGKQARFVWLPLEVVDDSDHRRGAGLKYKPMGAFSAYKHLCGDHATKQLGDFLAQKNFYFSIFRPPIGSEDGYLS